MQFYRQATSLFLVLVMTYWVSLPHLAFSQTSSSTSYKVTSQSTTNCGGGYSSSTSYKLFDSLCETAPGDSSSNSYSVQSGFTAMTDTPSLTVDYSTTTLSFGTLSRSAVASASVTVTVTTNATNGYSVTVLGDGNFRKSSAAITTTATGEIIPNVTDGEVTAGGNEYGVSTSTTDFSIPTSTPRVVNASSSTASAEATTVTFKVAAGENTSGGTYTQTLTLITTSTF